MVSDLTQFMRYNLCSNLVPKPDCSGTLFLQDFKYAQSLSKKGTAESGKQCAMKCWLSLTNL